MESKIEYYSDFPKIIHGNPPESFSEKQARLAIADLVELPFQISRCYGLFPLAFVKEKLELHFCRQCLFTCLTYLMLLSCPVFFQTFFSDQDLEKIFDIGGSTEKASNVFVNLLTQSFDTYCVVKVVWDHKRIQKFCVILMANLKALCVKCGKLTDNDKALRELKTHKTQLQRVFGVCVVFGILSVVNCFIFYGAKAYTSGMVWWKIIMIFILTFYWVTLHQTRVITFLLCISLIICFKVAFQCLRGITDMNEQGKQFWTRNRIPWAIQRYQDLESILKEFNTLFSFQLCNICFTTLIISINSWFYLTTNIGKSEIDLFDISASITIFCSLIVLNATLVVLCNVCSSMSNEATEFAVNFRDFSNMSQIPVEEQEFLIPFYMSVLSNPPEISPGRLFTLGRHTLSNVYGLIATYLVVLQQFSRQEQLLNTATPVLSNAMKKQ